MSGGMSSARSRSGGIVQLDDVEPVEEVLAEGALRPPCGRGRGSSRR